VNEIAVLVVGSGGREHALARALAHDRGVSAVHCAPGNPGTARIATNHPVDASDPAAVAKLARELAVDLVVVGPEAPLVAGVADAVRDAGIACFGPSAAAAKLEGSKAFAKEVMEAAGVPLLHDGLRGRRGARRVRRPVRREGRRARGRQGCDRHERP
jgi:phosphoribosylamine--glycine ligase